MNTQDYLIKGVKLIENSSLEIKNATKEMYMHLSKKKLFNRMHQNFFFSLIDKDAISPDNKKIHNKFNCLISNTFLKKNRYLFK